MNKKIYTEDEIREILKRAYPNMDEFKLEEMVQDTLDRYVTENEEVAAEQP